MRTKDGTVRTYRLGANFAAMVGRLLYWEGKGELPGGWVYKTAAEWEEETGLTERKQRTARCVGVAEGLWEEKKHTRRDGRTVVAFRLDAWRLWQIVNGAQIAAAKEAPGRARDPIKKAELRAQLGDLEKTRVMLALEDVLQAEDDWPAHRGIRRDNDAPHTLSGDPLHNGPTAWDNPKELPPTGDPSRGAGSAVPAARRPRRIPHHPTNKTKRP